MGAFKVDILNIILAIIVSLLGLPVGFLLAKIAKEELEYGKIYFQWMRRIILIAAILFVFYSFNLKIGTFILIAIMITGLIIRFDPNAIISYFIFSILLFRVLENINLLVLTFSLVFLYGLPTGALMILRGFVNYMREEIENPINIGFGRKLMQKIKYVLWVTMLEILTFPSLFMEKKKGALYHLKFVCPICPSSRKKHRDVHGKSTCWWEYNWLKGKYNVPKHFGMINWIKQYIGYGTNLKKFRNFK
ncbi:hypothetical protein GOV06_05385 [Candidatus Woesearchaeota archaeon]|nr:hypothetical protein [Candidatus Woesearchaeota archaeon]